MTMIPTISFRQISSLTAMTWVLVSSPGLYGETTTSSAQAQNSAQKPNIIFILTDDQRWDSLGVMGNPIIQTPNLDRLASAGIIFENTYVTTSICAISRASILSGQYQSRHEINNFSKSFTPEQVAQTYPSLLKAAGYKTGFVGKYGVGKKQPSKTFDFWACTTKTQPDYITTDTEGRAIHDTDKVSNNVQRFLNEYGKDSPFCLSVSFKAPHEQDGRPPRLIVQPRYKDLYNDVPIPTPVTAEPKYWNSFPDFFRTDKNIARERWEYLFSTPEKYQENVKNYYRLITGVDEAVGKMVQKLKDLGVDNNTVIIYTGDNGFSLGEHGLQGKWFGYEESIRVPLIINYAGLPDQLRQGRFQQIALNIDIAPTICAMAGIGAPLDMQGTDLISMLKNGTGERNDFFYEHTFLGSPKLPQIEGVVTEDLKYMKFIEHDYEELYDIAHDPHETTNLAHDPAYQSDLTALRARYDELKKSVK